MAQIRRRAVSKEQVKAGKERKWGGKHTGPENADVGTDDRAMNTNGEELQDPTKDHEPRDG